VGTYTEPCGLAPHTPLYDAVRDDPARLHPQIGVSAGQDPCGGAARTGPHTLPRPRAADVRPYKAARQGVTA
jgi:hypothetical protein